MRYRVMLQIQPEGTNPHYGMQSIHSYSDPVSAVLYAQAIAHMLNIPVAEQVNYTGTYPCITIAQEG